MTGAAAKDGEIIPFAGKKPRGPGRRKRDREMVAFVREVFETYQELGHPCANPECRSLACRLTRRAAGLLETPVEPGRTKH